MSEIAGYPANYNRRNLSLLLSKIDGRSCVTLISPAGYGKSKLLRFLAENPHCKKFAAAKNVEFLFLDLSKLDTVQAKEESALSLSSNSLPHLPQFLLQEIRHFYGRKGWDANAELANVDLEKFPEQIHEIVERLIKRLRRKSIYIMLDNFATLLTPDRKHDLQLIKSLRNHHSNKLQYIFSLTGTRYLDEQDEKNIETISSLLMHRVVLTKMVDVNQIIFGSLEFLPRLKTKLLQRISSKYKLNLLYIQQRTGGYLPYTRYFLDPMHLPNERELTREYDMSSARLFKSLTSSQQQILRGIATGNLEGVNKEDLKVLLDFELVRDTNHGLQLFSQIMREYLQRH